MKLDTQHIQRKQNEKLHFTQQKFELKPTPSSDEDHDGLWSSSVSQDLHGVCCPGRWRGPGCICRHVRPFVCLGTNQGSCTDVGYRWLWWPCPPSNKSKTCLNNHSLSQIEVTSTKNYQGLDGHGLTWYVLPLDLQAWNFTEAIIPGALQKFLWKCLLQNAIVQRWNFRPGFVFHCNTLENTKYRILITHRSWLNKYQILVFITLCNSCHSWQTYFFDYQPLLQSIHRLSLRGRCQPYGSKRWHIAYQPPKIGKEKNGLIYWRKEKMLKVDF